ncbi:hypothetical protein llap_14326 [Limosa lapponica baueri]|uniref:Uncharacterized protein n=1 Tax=Limosa lapponica baueri TaxID=1758121 RepID=A0A2I0TNH0_LIMLA|nr:hypothetical protein llap_14326 [Limosa lapponica baueri]
MGCRQRKEHGPQAQDPQTQCGGHRAVTLEGEVMGAAVKAAWLEGEKYLREENICWKNTNGGNACQLENRMPGNQAWEPEASWRSAQLASLKYSWAPRNQRHPEIPSTAAKTRNCNSNFWSEKVKNSLEKMGKHPEKV